MPLLGAHMSIAGGYYKAADAAAKFEMETVQIFTKNNNQWRAKPLTDEDTAAFDDAIEKHGLARPCSHASYLINLASPKDDLWEKSREAFIVELRRAEALSLEGVVLHPGSYTDSSEEAGLNRIATAFDVIHKETPGLKVKTWLEATAGQGTNLGCRFEHLAYIREHVAAPERISICVDTCHIFAAGYPIQSASDYQETMQQFDDIIGIEHLASWHLNDSKQPFGSRKDRHEHIGEGEIGEEAFGHVLNDPRMAELPMYLETPKSNHPSGNEADAENLARLRGLLNA